jgi:hydrogenase maturation protease
MNAAFENTPALPSAKLVIGIGNEFRGDDGAGLLVARRLRETIGTGARVAESSGEGTELMSLWAGTELVVLVDAVHSGSAPGQIFRFGIPGDAIPTALFPRHSTHAFGVLEAIELGKTLGSIPPRVIVYGIEGATFEAGTAISAEVEISVVEVAERIVEDLA